MCYISYNHGIFRKNSVKEEINTELKMINKKVLKKSPNTKVTQALKMIKKKQTNKTQACLIEWRDFI